MAEVPSVDALSEIINSKSSYVWPSKASSDSPIYFSPLYTGSPMLSRGAAFTLHLRPCDPYRMTMTHRFGYRSRGHLAVIHGMAGSFTGPRAVPVSPSR